MSILNLEHISKNYGEKVLFSDLSCGIEAGDRIGIIGVNGAGKSTLLRLFADLSEADSGRVIRQNGIRLVYLPQEPVFGSDETLLSYVLSDTEDHRWHADSDAKTILTKLGFTEAQLSEPVSVLSGGLRKKAALAKTLLDGADVLLLDEPTNHLDQDMVQWLEEYLRKTKKTVIMVTHDRYFLDRVCTRILELDHGKLYSYLSDYSGFLLMKAEREEMELASERKRKSVLRMELEWAKRGCRARTTKQKARLDRLEELKQSKGPEAARNVEMDSVGTRMGKKTIEFSHISKSYDSRKLIDDFSYIVLRGQRLGFIGSNGCGKSTLMKILCGTETPDSGTVTLGVTIRIGCFSQTSEEMNGAERVIDYIRDAAEYIETKEGRISASQLLERFLFSPEMQYTPIGKLSGGERRRLQLLRVLASAPNVLVLDEPTNDLDIPTLTILEDYLTDFPGIVITVSHDRYFLDNVVDRIFAFEENGRLQQYEGGYTDYLRARERRQALLQPEAEAVAGKKLPAEEKTDAAGKNWKQNRTQKLKFSFQEKREYDTIEGDIEALTERIEALEAEMSACASDYVKLSGLAQEKEETEQQLSAKMDRWVYLSELADAIANQSS